MSKIIQIATVGCEAVNSVAVAAAIYALDDQGRIFERCFGHEWVEMELPKAARSGLPQADGRAES